MALHASALTTEAEMQEYFSDAGVRAFTDHDASGSSDTNVVNNCINRATSKILDYAGQQYEINAAFIAHQTVRDWATVIACYVMNGLRGSPRTESITDDYQETIALLQQVLAGSYQLYGLAKRGGKAPGFSNLTIDRRHPYRKARVKPNSSNAQQSPQSDDLLNSQIDY